MAQIPTPDEGGHRRAVADADGRLACAVALLGIGAFTRRGVIGWPVAGS